MKIQIEQAALRRQQEQVGAQIAKIVNDTVNETVEDSVDVAVDKLHRRLNQVGRLSFPRTWSQNAVETMRRGESLEIRLG